MMKNSTNNMTTQQTTQVPLKTDLYKTEMCRKWVETGKCKYGKKCQYAHGYHELRNVVRHQKVSQNFFPKIFFQYKSKLCKNFHETGICPYGKRCNFIHNQEGDEEITSTETSPILIPTSSGIDFPIFNLQSPTESLVSDSEHHDHISESENEEEQENNFNLSNYVFEQTKRTKQEEKEDEEETVELEHEEEQNNFESDEDEEFERLENEIFD